MGVVLAPDRCVTMQFCEFYLLAHTKKVKSAFMGTDWVV